MNKPLKRHNALHSLSHDHHHGLVLAQLAKKSSPEYTNLPKTTEDKIKYAISFYNDELVRHFRNEEEILFPVVKGKDEKVDNLIDEIIDEHIKMKELIKSLRIITDSEDMLDEFGCLLESHIRKEERELFKMIQNILTEEELNLIGNKLK